MAKRDFYEILGVDRKSDDAALKKAYRKLAVQYHPDKNPGDKAAEEKFKEAAEAYEILSDPQKRALYDRHGHQAFEGGMPGGGGFRGGAGGMTMEDIFAQFGDIFGDGEFGSFFGGRGGGGRSGRPTGQKGSNLRIKVALSLEEISTGVSKKIKVRKQITCNTCNGSGAKDSGSMRTCTTCNGVGSVRRVTNTFLGQMATTEACPTCQGRGQMVTNKCGTCHGHGVVEGEETLDIDIPAGVEEGMNLQMRGRGNSGRFGGPAGDLIITIEEKPHDHLQRDGQNLIFELYLNFADATLGCSEEVVTIDGPVKIKIPAGTQSGKILRLKDKGLPTVQGAAYGRGDQLIHVNIWTPKKFSEEERVILEKLREAPNFKPQPGKSEKTFFEKMRDYFK
jgi:molecular chaperone DnaJ